MYVEADLIYSLIKPEDWLKPVSEKLFKKLSKEKLFTSVITVTEIEIVSRREIGIEFSDKVLELIESRIKNIEFIPLTKEILKRAVEVRKKHGLNIFDSLHSATCLVHKEEILSTDKVFDFVKDLKRIDPRDFIR